MVPFYIYYSMFGFQRIGDLIWAAADQRARGFLVGATSGRTTLGGEGLQHQDGQSHVMAATVPNCRAYDPAFAGELAVIVGYGMKRMLQDQHDEFYYLTVTNENMPHPSLPEGVEDQIIAGMYRFAHYQPKNAKTSVRLLGSGSVLLEVKAAAEMLAARWSVEVELWSVTSFTELEREARSLERWSRLHPSDASKSAWVSQALAGGAPVIACTDYIRALPQLIAPYVDAPFTVLGTDGFGRSDTRSKLREFFEIDKHSIVIAALYALRKQGSVSAETVQQAIKSLGVSTHEQGPWEV
jgi:pyruvate dehydrogenase E1 component